MLAPPNHHFLPSLDPDAGGGGVPMPGTAAQWVDRPSGLLQSIANGISVDDSATTRGVSSVPDVWARALLFQSALRPTHPLHTQAVADWRGLLSLLALREIYGYDVEVVPVSLTGSGKLERALRSLAPASVDLQPNTPYAWTDVLLVRLDGISIGAFSPGSLVYTATDYRDRLRAHYEPDKAPPRKRPDCLGADYSLLAPTRATDEHSAHFVAEYVHDLYQSCSQMLSGVPEAQRISELLEAWLAELRLAFGYNPQDRINAPEVKVSPALPTRRSAADWPRMAAYGVYHAALRPIIPDEDSGDDPDAVLRKSSLFLRHQRNHSAYRGVVVVHKDTLSAGARVWGLRRLASLGETVQGALDTHFNAPSGRSIGGEDLAPHKAAWIRPERFFLTDVLLAPREGTHALANGEVAANAKGEYVLPFRREVLEFFGPEAIQTVLAPRFDRQSDGSVKFSFRLPVGAHPDLAPTGDGQAGIPPRGGFDDGAAAAFSTSVGAPAQTEPGITVERLYRVRRDGDPDDGSGAIQKVDLPVLDLFPDYLGPSWRRYWLFQSDRDRFDCRPYAQSAAVEIRERKEPVDGTQRSVRITEVHGDDAFPDGVEIRAANGTPGGLIVTKRSSLAEGGVAGGWTVGIDFGTSNTNVAIMPDGGGAVGWTIDFPAMLRMLTADPAGRRDDLLQAFFVPNRTISFPISTHLDPRVTDLPGGRPFIDYLPDFPRGFRWRDRVRTHIKWDEENDRVTRFFLEPLLLLLLAEATRNRIATLRLRCTYPKAFTLGMQQVFRNEWDETVRALIDAPHTPADEQNPQAAVRPVANQSVSVLGPDFYSEGKMAGHFFAHVVAASKADAAKAICIDVGGGTSDIALIYDGGKIVFDSSVRMAGGTVSDLLAKRPPLRKALFSQAAQDTLTEALSNPVRAPKLFSATLNEVLRAERGEIPGRLNKGYQDPEVIRLRQMIALQFGALAFYAGTIIGAVGRHGVATNLASLVREGGISLHWGGNAGQLVTWIDHGRYSPDGLAAQFLNGLVHYALIDAETPAGGGLLQQAQSPAPKSESAYGAPHFNGSPDTMGIVKNAGVAYVLADEPDGAPSEARIEGVIAGENFTLLGTAEPVGFRDVISDGVMFTPDGSTRFDKSSGDRIRRFIDLYNRLGNQLGLVTAATKAPDDAVTMQQITGAVRSRYQSMQGWSEEKRSVEPVFITEVRELIDRVV